MADPEAQITTAIAAVRKAAESGVTAGRSAITEIEKQVKLIEGLTKSAEVEREGAYLVSRALERYTGRAAEPEIVLASRLHGAIARFELALRQLGFLGIEGEQPPQGEGQREK